MWLVKFALERLIRIYVKHAEQAVKEKVDRDQGNEGNDEL